MCLFPILAILEGCASRFVNPPMAQINLQEGYREVTRVFRQQKELPETLVLLAFSGGGTRAAAFSYGVLETLRDIELNDQKGKKARALDKVNLITGVSGGSFTALSYGLYGDKLFDFYDASFLKYDVQGELIARAVNPLNWTHLASKGWGRSEMAAELYDEILFHGATYADLDKGKGPFISASATDISTGNGVTFNQLYFDYFCSDLSSMPLSRAAAASSAVPFVLSPVAINNYGGDCKFIQPEYLNQFSNSTKPPRPAARLISDMQDLKQYHNSQVRPYIHLVDGGLADNLAMREVLGFIQALEAMHIAGEVTVFDRVKRIIIIIVNSLSSPENNWDQSVNGPGSIELLIKATGVPIDHYSYEEIETLKDTQSRWNSMRTLRNSALFAKNKDPVLAKIVNTPNIDLYAIDVSFKKLEDKQEYQYLNSLPTSFVLAAEDVERLKAAAKKIILNSPEFQQSIADINLEMTVLQAEK